MSRVQRDIRRVAFLLGSPHLDNLALVDEAAGKGYHDVGCFVLPPGAGWATDAADWETACRIAGRARTRGLGLLVATCYSKNMKLYLLEHPEQRLITRVPGGYRADARRGCPFHPDYKAQHVAFLRHVATLPALREVWIDDEARLGFSPGDFGCYCDSCRRQFRTAHGEDVPDTIDWDDPNWRTFVAWRFSRWTEVHEELAALIRDIRPDARVLFQTTPLVDLLGNNPWVAAIDLGAMAQGLDGLCADPYYAATETPFRPRQTYLSHWTRFLRGHVPRDAPVSIATGFSNPAAAYQPREEDGTWNGLIPPATGADEVCWLFYDLQRRSRTIATYEATFRLDPYLARAQPLRYAAVVHSFQSEVWRYAAGVAGGGSYDWTYVVPLAEVLRSHGVPFGYVADARLEPAELAGYRVLVLPSVACLSAAQRAAIRSFVRGGGGTVVFGDLDVCDERGAPTAGATLAQELFGIAGAAPMGSDGAAPSGLPEDGAETDPTRLSPFAPAAQGLLGVRIRREDHPIFAGLRQGHDPEIRLDHCLAVEGAPPDSVLATFLDPDGRDSGRPAILAVERDGARHVYFAGLPTASYSVPERAHAVFNPAPRVVRSATEWAARARPALFLDGFPPVTDYQRARPEDVRAIPTVEFFPLVGERLAVACFASYAYERYDFRLVVRTPAGQTVHTARELLTEEDVPHTPCADGAVLGVQLTPADAAKVFWIEWS